MNMLLSGLLASLLFVCATAAYAVDVRGRVETQNPYARGPYPFAQAPVSLFQFVPPGQWRIVSQTLTDPNGMYYFRGLPPGRYVVQVHGQNFTIDVHSGNFQDVPPILVRRF